MTLPKPRRQRRRMASAECGRIEAPKAPSDVGWDVGCCPLPSRLWGLGGRSELFQLGPGRRPVRKRIWAYFEGHRTLLLHLCAEVLGGKTEVWGQLPISCPKVEPRLPVG